MKKFDLKKNVILTLSACMMLQLAFTGCNKKEDITDYEIDYESDRTGIGGKLIVPEGCTASIDTGSSKLEDIMIEVEEIEVPDTDKMDIVYVTSAKYTNEEKKKLVEKIFDKNIYLYDYNHRTRDDIQKELDELEREIENPYIGGDEVWLSETNSRIEELKEMLTDAPDTYAPAGDYSGSVFIGERDNIEYLVSIDAANESNYFGQVGSSIYFEPTDMGAIRPYEGASRVEFDMTEDGVDISDANMSNMTEDDAKDMAEWFLAGLDITDVSFVSMEGLNWRYEDENYETLATECDGYVITYTKAIDGVTAYSENLYEVDNLKLDHAWIDIPLETYTVMVYDDKIIGANFENVFDMTDSEKENAELLSYSDIIKKANTEFAAYYEKYPTNYKTIKFNDVKLSYYLVSDGNDKYKYIPVWIFSQYEEVKDQDGAGVPVQIVILDAVSGEVIDIIEEAKKLGCYM